MTEITTTTIAITTEPEAQQLKQRLSPEADAAVLQLYEVVLERATDGVRVMIFLSLYMPPKMVASYGGAASLMPGMRGGDVLGAHGMRLQLSRLDLDQGILVDGYEGPISLSETEITAIRSALEQLLQEQANDN